MATQIVPIGGVRRKPNIEPILSQRSGTLPQKGLPNFTLEGGPYTPTPELPARYAKVNPGKQITPLGGRAVVPASGATGSPNIEPIKSLRTGTLPPVGQPNFTLEGGPYTPVSEFKQPSPEPYNGVQAGKQITPLGQRGIQASGSVNAPNNIEPLLSRRTGSLPPKDAPNFTLGAKLSNSKGLVPTVPPTLNPLPEVGAINGVKAINPEVSGGAGRIIGGAFKKASPFILPAAEAYQTYQDSMAPGMKPEDMALRISEGATRVGSSLAGAQGGAALGTMAFPGIGTALGGIGGGMLGYYAPDILNYVTGSQFELPSDKAKRLSTSQPSQPPQLGQQQTASVTPIASGQTKPVVTPPAQQQPIPSDKELLSMGNVSDTGIPFQQDTTGKVNITNPDGSGYGTIDAGSPEKNAAFAARLQDGKGAMYKGGGLPAARREQQPQGLPQLQMPMLQGGGDPYQDEIALTLDLMDQNQPDRFDSIGGLIAKKQALHGLAARLNALQGAQGNQLKSQSDNNRTNAEMGLSQQKMQADYLNNQASNQTAMAKAKMEQANSDRNYGLEKMKLEQPTFTPIYESGFDPQTQMETKKLSGGFNTKTGLPVLNSNAGNDKDQQDFMAAMSLAKDDKAKLHLLQQRHPEYFGNGQ